MKNIKTYEEYKGLTFKRFLELDNNRSVQNIFGVELLIRRKNLIDLNGIEPYVNLTYLDVSNNKITSLKPIKNLTKLEILIINGNKLSSLIHIENFINLEKIWCGYNKITSLKPILNLTNLYHLFCQDNPIDWVDYIDKKGNTWYTQLPKSITNLYSDKFVDIEDYYEFMNKNQPASVSRKFNF